MAVVRVKRYYNEEPLDAVVLACKRRKTEDDHVTSLFKFAATLSSQDESVSKHLSKEFGSTAPRCSYKTPGFTNITDKLRTKNKLLSQESRLKVVNCFRALNEDETIEESDCASSSSRSLTIVEIESIPSNTTDTSSSSTLADRLETESDAEKYVYDIYYAPDCDFDDKMFNYPISCHSLYDLVCEDYSADVCEVEEDSDDSNDENNWRNDYPDEDPDSVNEDDIKLACGMGGLNISETNSLSSDEGEEALVYGIDEPDCTFEISSDDENYFEKGYNAYKKRAMKDLDSEISENSDFHCGESDTDDSDVIFVHVT